MKFYGNGLVWDRDANKPLCKFIKKELETEDKHIIDRLIELGYEHDGEIPFDDIEEGLDELKAKAKDLGVKGYAMMKKETLIKKLEEV